MREARFPECNELGLVLPPGIEPPTADSYVLEVMGRGIEHRGDVHHLYWPYEYWRNLGGQFSLFQAHYINRVPIGRRRHVQEHHLFDQSVLAFPDKLVPERVIIEDFLDEAHDFDAFREFAYRYRSMGSGLRKNLYDSMEQYKECRAERSRMLGEMAGALLVHPTEIIPGELMQLAVERVMREANLALPAQQIEAA